MAINKYIASPYGDNARENITPNKVIRKYAPNLIGLTIDLVIIRKTNKTTNDSNLKGSTGILKK